ncbi:DNA alkylation repair protein [Hazenella sp. IB182357]|uniref:DNA alkylation repair protein n=1 Tax=Polycladospora coralii TaxID=2771432 RepID=A0A926RSU5_9BACL|nr:DNA alkylation repair protein [Polycladospora coralii]MBD1371925.1 DNA alkylation repair protein [Polycladospora coralii]MBS7529384.1 DNA alkylation repair protein [Polycladospora coralii]
MSDPYLCPACGTNRSRFNLIQQVVQPVKKDAQTGDVVSEVSLSDPLQFKYKGDPYRVQCGICGVIESEEQFIRQAQRS